MGSVKNTVRLGAFQILDNVTRKVMVWGALLFCWVPGYGEEPPLSDWNFPLDCWQVGGTRIAHSLGNSRLNPLAPGDGFQLSCDFVDYKRKVVSAYYLGKPLPGNPESIAFTVSSSDAIPPTFKLTLHCEDALGHFFQYDYGFLAPQGETSVPIAVPVQPSLWHQLLRTGEETAATMALPLTLRQIAFNRGGTESILLVLKVSQVKASTRIDDVDRVEVGFSTGKYAHFFCLPETPVIKATLSTTGSFTGEVRASVTDYFGEEREVGHSNNLTISGEAVDYMMSDTSSRLGSHLLRLCLVQKDAGHGTRTWQFRFGVGKPPSVPISGRPGYFGVNYAHHEVFPGNWASSQQLMRIAGITWVRMGGKWLATNPAEGVWIWNGWPQFRLDPARGKVLQFTSRNAFVTFPTSPRLDCTDGVTIACWVNRTGPSDAPQFPLQRPRGTGRNYGLVFNNGNFGFCATSAGGEIWVTSGASQHDSDSWHHYAATYSAADKQVCLYRDGVLTSSFPQDMATLSPEPGNLLLGQNFSGGLDNLVLSRRALSGREIGDLFKNRIPSGDGLLGYWPMNGAIDQKEETIIRDASGNGLDFFYWEARQIRQGPAWGIHAMLLMFPGPPKWASSAPSSDPRFWTYPVSNWDQPANHWTTYLREFATRYGNQVRFWELCNEPNNTTFWSDGADLATRMRNLYERLLLPGYGALKGVDAGFTVMAPGLAGPNENRSSLEDALYPLIEKENAGGKCCDAISIHPYRQASPEESGLEDHLKEISGKAGNRPLWITEDSWIMAYPTGSTEARAARMLARAYVLALSSGVVQRIGWFRFQDPGPDRFYTEHNYALCANDGTPKPAYFAHRIVSSLLDRTTPETSVIWDVGPRARARSFRTPAGRRIIAVWCPEGSTRVSFRTGPIPVWRYDLMGNLTILDPRNNILSLEVTEDVVFLLGGGTRSSGLGDKITVTPDNPYLVPGISVPLDLTLSNPFPDAVTASLSLPSGWSLVSDPISGQAIPARGTLRGTIALSVPGAAAPGLYQGSVAMTNSGKGEDLREELIFSVHAAPADGGPAAFWKFEQLAWDEAAQRNKFYSESNPDLPYRITTPGWLYGSVNLNASGHMGKAMEFGGMIDGVNSWAQLRNNDHNNERLTLTSEFTLAGWVNFQEQGPAWRVLLAHGSGGIYNYGVAIHTYNVSPPPQTRTGLIFYAHFENLPYRFRIELAPLETDRWYHVALTYSAFTKRLKGYRDGILVKDRLLWREGRPRSVSGPVFLGNNMKGLLDEVKIYPRALSGDEITALYHE